MTRIEVSSPRWMQVHRICKEAGIERPLGGFRLIYVDPPWSYRDKANAHKRGAAHKYPTMSIGELLNLRPLVDALAADDCALAMWYTAPLLPDALELVRGWGFRYKTKLFDWVKTSKGSPIGQASMVPKLAFGMGHWTRSGSEDCLLATRGHPKRVSARVRQVIMAPLREHSRKPEEARDRLVELFGNVPRVELFAREAIKGWDSWGNEVGKFNAKEAQ